MAKVPLRAYNREIETMIDRGILDEAVAHCRHILKTFPKHLETYRLLGKAYLEYKRFPDAVDIFSRVLVSAPSDFVANVGMSIIRDEENKLDDAIWHMERAFETQPSNAAIQSELQRLYTRRDGVTPPRIRMTRGALAHMYVQGELYPQAISEIKAVLKDDPGRTDMQVLLARAYYRSGLKNDAAEVASALLRSQPYNLDANRVLVEILGIEHPESVQPYRQRVVELDPYAAQVTSSIFLSDEVPENAVTLERLDWNGQPVGMQPDWESRQAIGLESGQPPQEEPDWLKGTFPEKPSVQPAPFDAALPSVKPAEPAEEIPDFLRAAGWGKSTGAFDESKSAFAPSESEPSSTESSIEQGDLPDWVKALAPQQPAETPAEEEELPDWINKIGTNALPVSSEPADQPDWLSQTSQPAAQPADEEPDWLKQLGTTEQPAAQPAEESDWLQQFGTSEPTSEPSAEPDWLKGFGTEAEPATPAPAESSEDLDWLTQLSQGTEARPFETSSEEFDFHNQPVEQLDNAAQTPASEGAALSSDDFDFLNPLGSQLETTPSEPSAEDFDFLKGLTEEGEQPARPATSEVPTEPAKPVSVGMSAEEQDDSFAWLESLAAKQGATEGLLTTPEERLEEEPDWVKQAKGMDVTPPAAEQEPQPPVTEPAKGVEELGKTEQEFDDSFAWLEGLAAKQGATEGLLTKPEERLEEEPEWVRQAKSLGAQPAEIPPVQQAPEEAQTAEPAVSEPAAAQEESPVSEQQFEDSFTWLESLAAKQGASEGLLTKPEERPTEEPDWIKQARDMGESAAVTPVAEQPSADDTAAWLKSLDEEAASEAEPVSSKDDTAIWFKKLEASEQMPSQPVEATPAEDLPAWLRDIEQEKTPETEEELGFLTDEMAPVTKENELGELPEVSEWMSTIEQESVIESVAPAEEKTSELPAEEIPSWLGELDQEPERAATPGLSGEDLPAWLRDETGELVAEPTRIEPTHAADWQPEAEPEPTLEQYEVQAREAELEPVASQPEAPVPEPVMEQPEIQAPQPQVEPAALQPEIPAAEPQPEPVMAQPEVETPQPEAVDVVNIIEERIAAVAPEAEQTEPTLKPYREPARKVTGPLSDPVLAQARGELARSNVSGAVDHYSRLIRKGRLLEDIIYDLREALYRYPVDVGIWQSLGDAYMRSNRLQDALDAYTKAEELLR